MKSMESLRTQADAAEQTLQQLSGKKVDSAMEEFSKAVCVEGTNSCAIQYNISIVTYIYRGIPELQKA